MFVSFSRNIDAADSLIEALALRNSTKLSDDAVDEVDAGSMDDGVTHSKSERTVIEEFHAMNRKLRELISHILIQLEESRKETKVLRAKVMQYESSSPQKKVEVKGSGDQNLIDLNSSMSSSAGSVGNLP